MVRKAAPLTLLLLLFAVGWSSPAASAADWPAGHVRYIMFETDGPFPFDDFALVPGKDLDEECTDGELRVDPARRRLEFADTLAEQQCRAVRFTFDIGYQVELMDVRFEATRNYSREFGGGNLYTASGFRQMVAVYDHEGEPLDIVTYAYPIAGPQPSPRPYWASLGKGSLWNATKVGPVTLEWAFTTTGTNEHGSDVDDILMRLGGARLQVSETDIAPSPDRPDRSLHADVYFDVAPEVLADGRSLAYLQVGLLGNATPIALEFPSGKVLSADDLHYSSEGTNRSLVIHAGALKDAEPGRFRLLLEVPTAPAATTAENGKALDAGSFDDSAAGPADETGDDSGPGEPAETWPWLVPSVVVVASALVVALSLLTVRRRNARRTAALKTDGRSPGELMAFLDSVVHDLKTPLIALDWLTQDMEQEIKGAHKGSLEGSLVRIRSNVDGMDRLVADLLAISRLERGEDEREEVALVPLVEDVVAAHQDAAARRSIRVSVEARAAPVMQADAPRVRQAVANLVSNALKYGKGEGGRILVRIEVPTKRHRPDHVRIEVWDDGPGVPPAHRERVFRMFERNPDETRSIEGTGLGLALVRKVAEHYGGKAWVTDAPGGGARFIVTLDADRVGPVKLAVARPANRP